MLKSESNADLGESLNHILTRLEDLGVDGLPADLEIDLRHIMNLESPSVISKLKDLEDDDLDDDLLDLPFNFSPEEAMSHFSSSAAANESRFFNMDPEDFKSQIEPFMLLPNQLSLNKEGFPADFEQDLFLNAATAEEFQLLKDSTNIRPK